MSRFDEPIRRTYLQRRVAREVKAQKTPPQLAHMRRSDPKEEQRDERDHFYRTSGGRKYT